MSPHNRRASHALLFVGVAVMATYAALPAGGLVQALVFLGWLSLGAGLLVARVHRDRRTLPHVWWVLAAGLGVYVTATFVWLLMPVGFGVALGFPSLVDGMYFVSYALFGWFLLTLIGRRRSDGDEQHLAVVDAAIFTNALLSLLWEGVIEPNVMASGVSLGAKAVAVAYPAFAALLFGLAVRLVLGGIRGHAVDLLLMGWIGGELLSDIFYGYTSANAMFSHGQPMNLGWLGAYTALAALAVHPRLAAISIPASKPSRSPGRGRLVLLLVAALLPIALAIVHVADAFLLVNAAIGFLLVIVRLSLVSGDLNEQRRLAGELSRLSEELHHRALHDSLTGLGNRALLMETLDRAVDRRVTQPGVAALLLIDLDGFKSVNDTLGHEAGDHVLVEAAARLRQSVRSADTVTRLGGDEFAVLMEDVSTEEALRSARRILEVLREPVRFAGRALPVRSSVGVHLAEAGTDTRSIIRNADLAMYAAKAAGGDRYEMYEAELYDAFVARHELELQLREAIVEGQLHVYYQPIIDLTTNVAVGAEALLRWQHPQRGVLLPEEFLDVAETSGAIVTIGRWVLEQACLQYMRWQAEHHLPDGFVVTVNLSGRELLDPLLVENVAHIVKDTGCPPHALVIEVAETDFMTDAANLPERLQKLRSYGVTIAMDDFGTGYSSLRRLRELPIDLLKIDQSFVTGIADRTEDFDLATTIVRLATSLNLRTLAEGVETPEQLAHLRALKVDLAQGCLFAPALLADDVVSARQSYGAGVT